MSDKDKEQQQMASELVGVFADMISESRVDKQWLYTELLHHICHDWHNGVEDGVGELLRVIRKYREILKSQPKERCYILLRETGAALGVDDEFGLERN